MGPAPSLLLLLLALLMVGWWWYLLLLLVAVQAALVKAVEMTRKSVKTADRPKLLSVLSLIKEAQELPKLDLPPGGRQGGSSSLGQQGRC